MASSKLVNHTDTHIQELSTESLGSLYYLPLLGIFCQHLDQPTLLLSIEFTISPLRSCLGSPGSILTLSHTIVGADTNRHHPVIGGGGGSALSTNLNTSNNGCPYDSWIPKYLCFNFKTTVPHKGRCCGKVLHDKRLYYFNSKCVDTPFYLSKSRGEYSSPNELSYDVI